VGDIADVQTAQSQPSVGTPIDVPLPRKVRVASIVSERCLAGRVRDQRQVPLPQQSAPAPG
jgi:hypothetical protein